MIDPIQVVCLIVAISTMHGPKRAVCPVIGTVRVLRVVRVPHQRKTAFDIVYR